MQFIQFVRLTLVGLLLILGGCQTTLAPAYDAALYKGVTDANVQMMQLLASLSAGTKAADCDTRADSFNQLIGKVDALTLQSKARPMPDNKVLESINTFLANRGLAVLNNDSAPSAAALQQVSDTLSMMKVQDCKNGINAAVVPTFRNQLSISMDQAITYEAFLNR